MAEIAIIIPVYNAEKYIRRCMDSVLHQTYQDFEIILINDGSSDSSLALCYEYSRIDARVTVLDKPNGGAASARNMGLDWLYSNSSCEWLCFIDADDFVHERYLEILLNAAKEEKTAVSMCSYQETQQEVLDFEPNSVITRSDRTEIVWCEHQIFCTVPVIKLFRRELFKSIRFPEGIIHEDEFTLYRVLFQCDRVGFVDLPLYGYFQTEASVMRGKWTPRHMTEPDGLLAQLEFFLQNHYEKAAKYTAGIYLHSIYRNLQGSKQSGDIYIAETRKLRSRLQKALLQYARLAELTFRNAAWLFYEAFPYLTAPYRAINRLSSTIKKKNHERNSVL